MVGFESAGKGVDGGERLRREEAEELGKKGEPGILNGVLSLLKLHSN